MKKSRKKSKTHSNSQKVTTKVKIVTTKVKKKADKQSNIHAKGQIVTTKVKDHENIRSQRKSRNVTGNVKKSQKK